MQCIAASARLTRMHLAAGCSPFRESDCHRRTMRRSSTTREREVNWSSLSILLISVLALSTQQPSSHSLAACELIDSQIVQLTV